MITHKHEPMAERMSDAADAVKHAWAGARERGEDVVDAARERVESARHKVGDAQDVLADQLESAAAALRHSNNNPVARMARSRPTSTVAVAFAAGALVGVIAGMLVSSMRDES